MDGVRLAVFLAPMGGLALVLMVLPGSLLGVFIGPSFAVVQELVDHRRRALGAAFFLGLTNLVAGFGPLVVGLLSDLLEPIVGPEARESPRQQQRKLGACGVGT